MPIITEDPDNPNIKHVQFSNEELDEMPAIAGNDTPIIRYLTIPKLLGMLVSKSIWFVRPDKFSDEYEGFSVINIDDENAKETADFFRKTGYVNCWNWFRRESFHLWHIYGGSDKYGLAITSTVEKFKNSIADENIKSTTDAYLINYVEPYRTYDGINGLICNTRKKNWYDYEEEIRFINYQGYEVPNAGENVELDIVSMIDSIILSPYVDDWFIPAFKDLIQKYGLNPDIVKKSEIRDSMLNK